MIRRTWSRPSVATLVVAGAIVLALTGTTACATTRNVVDGKAIVSVPGSDVPCYFLEIDRENGSEEVAEGYQCVTEAEWNENEIGEVWMDANGNEK